MSEEIMEPRTFEDLWLMRKTSKEWFDGQLRYENVRKGADPEVGMVDSMSWHVVPFSDRVNVELHTHVIEEVRQNGHSMSLRTKLETLASYETMEAFRDSEWWGLTMEKFSGGDADASWLRAVEHEVEGTVGEIEAAMTLMERLSDLGVEVGAGAITVPLPKSESEAGNAN